MDGEEQQQQQQEEEQQQQQEEEQQIMAFDLDPVHNEWEPPFEPLMDQLMMGARLEEAIEAAIFEGVLPAEVLEEILMELSMQHYLAARNVPLNFEVPRPEATAWEAQQIYLSNAQRLVLSLRRIRNRHFGLNYYVDGGDSLFVWNVQIPPAYTGDWGQGDA